MKPVHVHAYRNPTTGKPAASCNATGLVDALSKPAAKAVQSSGYDWGRVKLYFTLGALWTKQTTVPTATPTTSTTSTQTGFNSPTGFLSANLDYNLFSNIGALTGCPDRTEIQEAQGSAGGSTTSQTNVKDKESQAIETSKANALVNLYQSYLNPGVGIPRGISKDFTPLSQKQARALAKACRGTGSFKFTVNAYFEGSLRQIPLTNASTSGGTTAAGSTANISQFQGAYLEGGAYVPLMPSQTQWTYHGQNNALFLAPIGKFGFQGFGSSAAGVSGISASIANPTTSEVNRFYSAGLRLGHFRLPADSDKTAPELISWLDVTTGKWNNFREKSGTVANHLGVAGQLKVPLTPLNIGFEVNVGPGGDYMSIFAGTRLDVGALLGKLVPTAK